jgi:streptogramin lyase
MRIRRESLPSFVAFFIAASVSAQAITEFPLPRSGADPYGIVAGPDGAVWFTEFRGNRIGRITTAGVVSEFATPTPNSGPLGIAAGPDGALWFAEDSACRVGRITTAGEITEIPTGAFAVGDCTTGIALGPDGNMWFTEWEAGQIGRITPAGVVTLFTIPDPPVFGTRPNDIVAGPDGALWFTDLNANRIGRITTDGVITQFAIPNETRAREIAAGPDGALWFTESEGRQIGRITTDGVVSFPIANRPLGAWGITAGPDGAIWFTEAAANRIGRITTDGIVTEFPLPTAASGPAGITTGPDGNIWFTERAANKIGRLTVPRAPAIDSRVLPVVGSTAGVGGSFFRTSVQLHNPTSTPITGRIVFHRSGVSGSGTEPALSYSLSPGQTQSIADLLPAMGRSGLGSADIEATSGSIPAATVRVFNDAGAAGTTGFTEEPMRAQEVLRPGPSGVLLLPADLTRFRFNLGVRTLEAGAAATLTVRDASGVTVATVSRGFPATYHEQQRASAFLGLATMPAGGSIAITVESGAGIFYGATVDNATGDPSLQVARPVAQKIRANHGGIDSDEPGGCS